MARSCKVFFLRFFVYVPARSKVISWQILTCDSDSTHSWQLYSAAPLGDQATSTMTSSWYPLRSYYPNIEETSPCPILIMPSAWLGSDKYQYFKSLVWLDQGLNLWGLNPPISQTRRRMLYSFLPSYLVMGKHAQLAAQPTGSGGWIGESADFLSGRKVTS